MPPKRKDKDPDATLKPKTDPIQADNELFLQAFEKPTQIYRYLRTRNLIMPIYLNRNLSYMKDRMSRRNIKFKTFKVDSLLERVGVKERKANAVLPAEYLSLLFMGFYDKQIEEVEQDQGQVKVEVVLIKNAHNRRKDTSAAVPSVIGTANVLVNPNEISLGHGKIPALSIASSNLDLNSPSPATYTLCFRIEHCPNNVLNCTTNGLDEHASKKMKPDTKAYSTELLIVDKGKKCQLEDGEYDLTVQDATNLNYKLYSPKKLGGMIWESLEAPKFEYIDSDNVDDFSYDEVFNREPSLKFRLQWTKESLIGLVERPPPIVCTEANKENQPVGCVNGVNNNNNVPPVDTKTIKAEQKVRIIYHFVYNNNSRQQTETCSDFHCPWCSLNCLNLYALMKHLKLCHPRFIFTYIPLPDGARIDVAISESFDGSYIGSPHDLLHGFSRSAGPVKRSSCSSVLVCHPRRSKHSMSEFLELDENEFDSQRPYITGHNRLYHHTMTCLPVLPKELDIDSEGESDPNWLKYKTMQMIDEFTDVNEGEKELMKLWNLHVMKHGYVGDCQIPIACDMLLESKGKELVTKNLYRNFILHMCSLFDFGLISPENFYTTVQKLQKALNKSDEARLQMTKRHEEQSEYWKTTGIFKQIEQQKQQKIVEAQKQKELAIKKKHEENNRTLTITATDTIKASATLQGNKTVSSSIRTSSTMTVTSNINNNNKNGTAISNRDRKSLNISTNSSFTTHHNNTKQLNHSKSSANEHNRSALNKSGANNGTGGSNTRDRGLKRRASVNSKEVNAAKRRRSAGSIQVGNTHIGNNNKNTTFLASRRRSSVAVVSTTQTSGTGAGVNGNLNELLPKNLNPKIVLTRKSIATATTSGITSSSTSSSGITMRTRTSLNNATHHK